MHVKLQKGVGSSPLNCHHRFPRYTGLVEEWHHSADFVSLLSCYRSIHPPWKQQEQETKREQTMQTKNQSISHFHFLVRWACWPCLSCTIPIHLNILVNLV